MKFAGSIAVSGGMEQHSEPVSLTFPGGFVRVEAGVTVERSEKALCIAVGAPRFQETSLASMALSSGDGSAWIEAFDRFGHTAPSRVDGRFAVILLQPGSSKAFLATDKFGTWPVCYAASSCALHFSDRVDSVPIDERSLSAQAIFDYLFFHCLPAPETIFSEITRLPAGHVLLWDNGTTEMRRYWRPRFDEHQRPEFESSKRMFLDIVRRSVEAESGAGNVGAFLSGGTDSSTVSGMLCDVLGRAAPTYSIGFDVAGYDEMEYARIAAKRFGTCHHEYYVTPADLLEGIPKVAVHYDQPFGNSSAVPAWICARRAAEDGITRMLAGDGGDELFGGNVRYAKQRVFGLYGHVPPILRMNALEPLMALRGLNRVPLVRKGASYVEQARVPMPDRMQMYNMLIRLNPARVFEDGFLARIDEEAPFRAQREVWRAATADSLVNRMLAFDWKYTLADNDLPKVTGTTQLAGVDVGFPLLSGELVAFSLSLPPEWKLKRFQLRWFFKEALRGFLPDEIIAKKKHGFGLPFGAWTCQHEGLQALAVDALGSFKQRGVVRADFIDALMKEHLPAYPGYYGEMVWILMMLEFWIRDRLPDWRFSA